MTFAVTPAGKKLIFFGALLFLLGLLQGGIIPAFTNPRMALSAHLAAVQSGMALMILGVIWQLVDLSEQLKRWAYLGNLFSIYSVWVVITLSAITGASKALPMAGKGYESVAAIEWLLLIGVYIGAGAGIAGMALVVFGLYSNLKQS